MSQPPSADPEERFHELLAAHGPALRRLSRAYLASRQDQQDLFQEIALALWKALPRFRGHSTERTWVYRVAHNVALTFRSKRHRRPLETQLDERIGATPRHDADLDVAALLRALGPLDRQLLTLDLEGLTDREIAEVTGLTTTNIGVRLMRAKRKLAATVRTIGSSHA